MHRSRRSRTHCPTALLGFTAVMLLANGAVAQFAWQRVRALEHTDNPLLAHDTARELTVMYDASSRRLWELDGVGWAERTLAAPPPLRLKAAMVFDQARRRFVMFGGLATASSNETWEWDGSTWLQRTPLTSPPGRWEHAMAYDAARQRVVMFGGHTGVTGGTLLADTWEWDGAAWLQRAPANVPMGRSSHAMTYDAVRQRVVMFGGGTTGIAFGDTWEWNGVDWQAGPTGPPSRSKHAIAYDPLRQRTVLFGGGAWQQVPPLGTMFVLHYDTWEWNGATWAQASPVNAPIAAHDHAMVFDGNRQRVVMLFSTVFTNAPVLQWEWDGIDWSQGDLGPSVAQEVAFDSVRGRTVMLAGDRTWEWDGVAWHRIATSSAAPTRFNHATAFDVARQRVVVFGGSDGLSHPLGDTWTWDGSVWTQHAVPGPSPRWQPSMAYDPVRQRTVLFGGTSSGGASLGDTWEWDGQSWTQVVASPSPSPRSGAAMAWDGVLQRSLLFGNAGLSSSPDAWNWDGAAWTQLPTPTSALPPFEMSHDAGRNRVVLVGMVYLAPFVNEPTSWDWDGAAWVPLMTGPPRIEPIAGDVLGRIVGLTSVLSAAPRATGQDSGTPCGGSGAPPRLVGDDPYFGNHEFALDTLDAPANAPCIFGLAFGGASVPLGAGCTVLIDTPFSLALASANAAGVARTPTIAIPVIPVLAGVQLHAQALVLDPQAPLGFSLTARRTLTAGP
jgi:hypothetical protein